MCVCLYACMNAYMNRVVRKWAFRHMQAAKLQTSLLIHAISPETLLFAFTSSRLWYNPRQTAKLPARLRGWAGSPEALLLAYASAYFLTTRLIWYLRTYMIYLPTWGVSRQGNALTHTAYSVCWMGRKPYEPRREKMGLMIHANSKLKGSLRNRANSPEAYPFSFIRSKPW